VIKARRSGVESTVFQKLVERRSPRPPPAADLVAGVDLSAMDAERLAIAFTHPSWSNEQGGEDYQRFEFLGDAVIKLCAAHYVFREFPAEQEGLLSTRRHHLEDNSTLARHARRLGLVDRLRAGRKVVLSEKVHADVYEALVGVIFCDLGLESARTFVEEGFQAEREAVSSYQRPQFDSQNDLQELCMRRWKQMPVYVQVAESGPKDGPTFEIEVRLPNGSAWRGQGSSKKEARRAAATAAMAGSGG
jgi:ribonuclease-3